ncbi:hypothetical protein FACS189447_07780 [Spirochaetia bacterium]|nr:hypothetical protein FACS189447_07780 [Spirochaetia bacterium]
MEQEKELIEIFRQMNRETKDLYLSHGRIAIIAEESAKREILKGPAYRNRNPAPMGAALAEEALHG